MYFFSFISAPVRSFSRAVRNKWTVATQLVFVALMAALASLFQSAGGFLPGPGYAISPLATAPILLGMLVSMRFGLIGYGVTILLLLLIQPSEVIVFPFTTGILGVGLGFAFRFLHRRLIIIFIGAGSLFTGIVILLYGLKFPVLGPGISSTPQPEILTFIFLFSLLYSWLWTEIVQWIVKRIQAILPLSR